MEANKKVRYLARFIKRATVIENMKFSTISLYQEDGTNLLYVFT